MPNKKKHERHRGGRRSQPPRLVFAADVAEHPP